MITVEVPLRWEQDFVGGNLTALPKNYEKQCRNLRSGSRFARRSGSVDGRA